MNLVFKILISSVFLLGLASILPGVHIDDFISALLLVLILAVLNFLVKPFLVLLTIPVTILTFGLFLLVINAAMILLADYLTPGFQVDGFWWAMLFSLLVSFFNSMVYKK
ncbi:MAG: phage holin family protein [Cytophagaceae bacterium]